MSRWLAVLYIEFWFCLTGWLGFFPPFSALVFALQCLGAGMQASKSGPQLFVCVCVCVACAPVSSSMCATFLRRGLDRHFPCTFQTGHFWWSAPCQDSWCLAGVLKFIRQYYGQSCAGNNQQKKTILCKKKKIFSSVTEREMFLDVKLSGF